MLRALPMFPASIEKLSVSSGSGSPERSAPRLVPCAASSGSVKEVPSIVELVREGRTIVARPGFPGLPQEAGAFLDGQGIGSGVVVPMRVEGEAIGMLGLDNLEEPRDYPDEIVRCLETTADVIASALARIDAEDDLQQALDRSRQAEASTRQALASTVSAPANRNVRTRPR